MNNFSDSVNNITNKLCPDITKIWYKAGTLAKIDPGPGDVKCEFSKKDKKFRLYKFSENFEWVKEIELPWKVIQGVDSQPRFILMIGNNPATFSFKKDSHKEYLNLQLKGWEYGTVFVG